MLPPMWMIEACMNMLVNTVCQVRDRARQRALHAADRLAGRRLDHAALIAGVGERERDRAVLDLLRGVGPLINDPPWRIASMYTITFTTISAIVTNGNRSVGMLSFSGITGC